MFYDLIVYDEMKWFCLAIELCLWLVLIQRRNSDTKYSDTNWQATSAKYNFSQIILPIKIDASFIKESSDVCFSAWTDALNRAKIIRGHDMKAGKDYGFQEIVMRAQGRYDILWKINGERHFLEE